MQFSLNLSHCGKRCENFFSNFGSFYYARSHAHDQIWKVRKNFIFPNSTGKVTTDFLVEKLSTSEVYSKKLQGG